MIQNKHFGKTLTVRELMDILSRYDEELPVLTEGCDCWGAAYGIELHEDDEEPHLLIKRDPVKN